MGLFGKKSLRERVKFIEDKYAYDEVWLGGTGDVKLSDAISNLYDYLGLEFGCKQKKKDD